jgi:hypothetical protein
MFSVAGAWQFDCHARQRGVGGIRAPGDHQTSLVEANYHAKDERETSCIRLSFDLCGLSAVFTIPNQNNAGRITRQGIRPCRALLDLLGQSVADPIRDAEYVASGFKQLID